LIIDPRWGNDQVFRIRITSRNRFNLVEFACQVRHGLEKRAHQTILKAPSTGRATTVVSCPLPDAMRSLDRPRGIHPSRRLAPGDVDFRVRIEH
jgi:hypothetical protein